MGSQPLSASEFEALFDSFSKTAFRLETLDRYDVDDERLEFEAFLAGSPSPLRKNAPWVTFIESAVAHGKSVSRLHVISEPLTPYLRYEFAWAYPFSAAAGEQIRILPRLSLSPSFVKLASQDFWLFDDTILVLMSYDAAGHYLGAAKIVEVNAVAPFIECRQSLWRLGRDFNGWLK